MNVGILTFHASHNYGSMLQAYALQHVLSNMGVESEIINFQSDIQKQLNPPPISFAHPRSSLAKILKEPLKTFRLRQKFNHFELFLRYNLNTGREIRRAKDISAYVAERKFQAIITGSDQIWNPACWDFDLCYALDFPYNGIRIAYAPSMGSHPEDIPHDDLMPLIQAICKYDFISTREKRGSEFLSKCINNNVETVIDPTLLLNQTDYAGLETGITKYNDPYIFYYTPREKNGWFEKAKQFANQMGLNLLVTQDHPDYVGNNVIRHLDCGPKEFLSIIKNAAICVGDSFHLLAFSLIFNKEFYLISNEKDSRMSNILKLIGLQNRLIIGESPILIDPDSINYSYVNTVMNDLRQSSLSYLKHALSI